MPPQKCPELTLRLYSHHYKFLVIISFICWFVNEVRNNNGASAGGFPTTLDVFLAASSPPLCTLGPDWPPSPSGACWGPSPLSGARVKARGGSCVSCSVLEWCHGTLHRWEWNFTHLRSRYLPSVSHLPQVGVGLVGREDAWPNAPIPRAGVWSLDWVVSKRGNLAPDELHVFRWVHTTQGEAGDTCEHLH